MLDRQAENAGKRKRERLLVRLLNTERRREVEAARDRQTDRQTDRDRDRENTFVSVSM